MSAAIPRPFDVVALLADRPDVGLVRGQVGAVVDVAGSGVLVEFADPHGRTIAIVQCDARDVLVLSYDVAAAK